MHIGTLCLGCVVHCRALLNGSCHNPNFAVYIYHLLALLQKKALTTLEQENIVTVWDNHVILSICETNG